MKICDDPPVHLTYCLNIHPGEDWDDHFEAIRTKSLEIRQRVAPSQPFGLGLRLGNFAADCLKDPRKIDQFKDFLKENDLYVYTINGFSYGSFHKEIVKERVYQPDWRSEKRRGYTIRLADILSELLPDGLTGSISTVPGSYKTWICSERDRKDIIRHLMECVAHLVALRNRKGSEINLALEPEPDCLMETTDDVVTFFTQELGKHGIGYLAALLGCSKGQAEKAIRRHLGICFDTCHFSVQGENLSKSFSTMKENAIRVSKVQLSSALKVIATERNLKGLRELLDPVYLHQVKAHRDNCRIQSYYDLQEALEEGSTSARQGDEWRIHFHVPLYFEEGGGFGSTSDDLTSTFFAEITENCSQLEIETYTFDVLPEALKLGDVVASVVLEYQWVIDRMPDRNVFIKTA